MRHVQPVPGRIDHDMLPIHPNQAPQTSLSIDLAACNAGTLRHMFWARSFGLFRSHAAPLATTTSWAKIVHNIARDQVVIMINIEHPLSRSNIDRLADQLNRQWTI